MIVLINCPLAVYDHSTILTGIFFVDYFFFFFLGKETDEITCSMSIELRSEDLDHSSDCLRVRVLIGCRKCLNVT